MRIALVHDWLTGMRGGERVLDEIAGLYPDADLYTLVHVPGSTSKRIEARRIETSPLSKLPGVRRYYRALLPLFPWAIRRFDLSGYDLVISCSHAVAKSVRTGPNTLHLCYCLTPMRYIWDQIDAYLGHGLLRSISAPLVSYLRRFDQRHSGAAAVTKFIATSTAVQDRIRRHYDRKASIVFPPVDVDAYEVRSTSADISADAPYLLVGGFVPYKAEALAIEAFRNSSRSLLVVGDGPTRRELERDAPSNVRFLGHVGNDELRGLYAECRALIYPQEEDFGIIAVEAQAAGRPVIAFGQGGARDTVCDFRSNASPTGIYFDEPTPTSLRAALDDFEANENAFDPNCIREWAQKFGILRFRQDFQREVDKTLELRNRL